MENKNEMCNCGHRFHGDARNNYGNEYICKGPQNGEICKNDKLWFDKHTNVKFLVKVWFVLLFVLLVLIIITF